MDFINNINSIIDGNLSNEYYEVAFVPTIINFFFCLVTSFVLRYFYIARANSLVGKNHIASVLPILSCIIFIVIVVVKSSLALSLGLVGALSIVRFRTPIKEPEELIYLFFAIAIGLGYGANQTVITLTLSFLLIVIMNIWLSLKSSSNYNQEFNLSIEWSDNNILLDDLVKSLEASLISLKIIRVDYNKDHNSALLMIEPNKNVSIDELLNVIRNKSKDINCSFSESNMNW